jgi:hypothetical protein
VTESSYQRTPASADQPTAEQTAAAPTETNTSAEPTTTPDDTSANTPEATQPSAQAVNTTDATGAQAQQADVTINQDPVVGETYSSPEATQRADQSGTAQPVNADAGDTGDDYDNEDAWGYRDLQQEAKSREINASGTREEIVARLREDDASKQQTQQTEQTQQSSTDTSQVLAGDGEGATANAGTETVTPDAPDASVTPQGDPGDQYPEHGSIGLDDTGQGQQHASILQGLSDERRAQQLGTTQEQTGA